MTEELPDTRSDGAGTSAPPDEPASTAGPAPASGGYGTPSGLGSGGSGDGEDLTGDDPQTDWLRDPDGSDSDESGTRRLDR
ncbi:MAG: hypothetical protein ACJ761_11795 [Chloroflexota bacterium]